MTLKEILALKKVNQNTVAEALNINKVNIRRYNDLERRSLIELEKIAIALQISLSELIQLIYIKDVIPYKLEEINEFVEEESQSQQYEKTEPSQKAYSSENENTTFIIRNLSKAVATCTESEKIANQNVQDLLRLLRDKK